MFYSFFLSIFLFSLGSLACDSTQPDPGQPLQPQAAGILRPLQTYSEDRSHLINVGEAYHGYRMGDVQPLANLNTRNLPSSNIAAATNLYWSCLNQPNFAGACNCIRAGVQGMNEMTELLYGSYMGAAAAAGYNYAHDHFPDFSDATDNQIFQNIKSGGSNGGVCRDIHPFLDDVYSCMGFKSFKSAGDSTLLWSAGLPHSSLHDTAVIEDAKGNYFLVNYWQIFQIQANSMLQATQKAVAYLGPFTTAQLVEFNHGADHLITTDYGEWKHDLMMAASFLPPTGGYAGSISTDGFYAAYRNKNFVSYLANKNGYLTAGAGFVFQGQNDTVNNHGTLNHTSSTTVIDVSHTQVSGQFYQSNQVGGGSSNTQQQNSLDLTSEAHWARAPGGGPLHYEADARWDSSFDLGGSLNQPYDEMRLGLGYYPSRDPNHGADMYMGVVSNFVPVANNNISHYTLDNHLEYDVRDRLSGNTQLFARVVASPSMTGYNVCGQTGGNVVQGGFCEGRGIAPNGDAFGVAPEYHKIFLNIRGCVARKYSLTGSLMTSNGEAHPWLNQEVDRTPGGETPGTAASTTLSTTPCTGN